MGFYSQAIRGQYQIVARQRSIDGLLENPQTSQALKERLRFVLEVRQFAETGLDLDANGHYLRYADLRRRFAVWNVFATPAFSLTPKSWWYPLVGRLDYRGYFSEAHARKEAARLKRKGFDVHVGGVAAYSTLGWFRDPVLNTFVFESETDLAELIFHELAHQRLFIPGDTDFNEAFATAVAKEGVRRWLKSRDQIEELARYEEQTRRAEQFAQLVDDTRRQLAAIYGETNGITANPPSSKHDPDALRENKQRAFDQLRENYSRLKSTWSNNTDYDAWFRHSLNNAQLNTVKAYYHFVPAFRRLLELQGGDLNRFYEAARKIGDIEDEKMRHRHLERLQPSNGE